MNSQYFFNIIIYLYIIYNITQSNCLKKEIKKKNKNIQHRNEILNKNLFAISLNIYTYILEE